MGYIILTEGIRLFCGSYRRFWFIFLPSVNTCTVRILIFVTVRRTTPNPKVPGAVNYSPHQQRSKSDGSHTN